MKKVFLLLLALTMLCSIFVLPASAEDYINYEVTIDGIANAPTINGEVKPNEYGRRIHRYSENRSQFDCPDDHDEYDNWDFDFYMTGDKEQLYLAWVVKSEIHKGLEKGTYLGDGTKISDEWPDGDPASMLGHIWWNSCVQFIITPGAPKKGETSYGNNYLDAGLALLGDGTQARVIWSTPVGFAYEDVKVTEWDAAIVRNDAAQITTYEVAIPWKYLGITVVDDSVQFGLSYAVAAQENYLVKKGMIEWQDAILGGKEPDKAGVITLRFDDTTCPPRLPEGALPSEAYGKTQLPIDGVDYAIISERAYLCTDPTEIWNMNTHWTYNMLFEPVLGKPNHYILIETGSGYGDDFYFTSEITDGMIALAVHSDGEGSGEQRRQDAMSLGLGSEVVLFGVDVERQKMLYSNAMFYVASDDSDVSIDESVEESVLTPEDSVESDYSVEESEEESKESVVSKENNPDISFVDEPDSENNLLRNVIILIVVQLVALVVVLIILFARKKS